MAGIVTHLVHGPRLEDLRHWGRLDDLLWPLDSGIWAEADAFELRAPLPMVTRTACRANLIDVSTRCRGTLHTPARCVGEVTQTLCRSTVRIVTHGWASRITHNAICGCALHAHTRCRGEKRGHNWTVVPVTEGLWTDREL